MLGTGTRTVSFDSSFRPLLGTPRRIATRPTESGRVEAPLFAAPEAAVGPLPLRAKEPAESPLVVCEDLASQRFTTGLDIRGSLAMDFLQRYVVRIDPDRGKLSFLSDPGDGPGDAVPLTTDGRRWFVRARVAGQAGADFLLATEFAWASGGVHVEVGDEWTRRGYAAVVREVDTWKQRRKQRVLRLESLQIGRFRHSGLVLGEHRGNMPNVLGLGYLVRYIVTFDFANRTMYLKPSRQFNRPDIDFASAMIRSGMGLLRSEGQTFVSNVSKASAAERAGIREHDVLVSVNGTDVAREPLFTVYKALHAAGDDLKLTVERGGERLNLGVRLPVDAPPRKGWTLNR